MKSSLSTGKAPMIQKILASELNRHRIKLSHDIDIHSLAGPIRENGPPLSLSRYSHLYRHCHHP